MRLAHIGFGCLALAATASGQSPQAPNSPTMTPGTTVVIGRVVEGLSNTPVSDAVVRLTGRSGSTVRLATLTTDAGEFVFTGVPGGAYLLDADRAGYWGGGFGSRRPGGAGRALDLKADVPVMDVRVPVWPMSAIEGTVRDEAGEPVVGVRVEASTTQAVGGRLFPLAPSATLTDDRGRYRIGGLLAGDFVVVIRSLPITAPPAGATDRRLVGEFVIRGISDTRPGSPERLDYRDVGVVPATSLTPPATDGLWYPTVFFPAADSSSEATPIRLAPGQTRSGVDFSLRPVRARRVSGRIVGSDGGGLASVPVRLHRLDSAGNAEAVESAIAFTAPGGDFVLLAVVQGTYEARVFDVRTSGEGFGMIGGAGAGAAVAPTRMLTISNAIATDPPTRWAKQTITVGPDDITSLSIVLREGLTIGGKFEFEGSAPRPNLQQRQASLLVVSHHTGAPAAQPAQSTALVDVSGTFRTIGLSPGRYFVRPLPSSFAAPWTVKSVSLNGREILDEPIVLDNESLTGLTITLTDRAGEVTVTARNASGRADDVATVLVFPAEERLWIDFGRSPLSFRTARVSEQGAVTIKGLPPGDYLATAVPDEDSDQWQLQARLRALARTASRLRLALGESKAIEVRTVREGR